MPFDASAFNVGITDLGNLTVVGPAAIVCCVWLTRRWHAAMGVRFFHAVAATFVATCLLKIVSRCVGESLSGTAFELSSGAPSGHMAMSTVVYGGMAVLLMRHYRSRFASLMLASSAIMLAGVGVTRVVLRAHPPADVAIGFLLGAAGVLWLCRDTPAPSRLPARHAAELLALLAATVVLMQLSGLRLDSAKFI